MLFRSKINFWNFYEKWFVLLVWSMAIHLIHIDLKLLYKYIKSKWKKNVKPFDHNRSSSKKNNDHNHYISTTYVIRKAKYFHWLQDGCIKWKKIYFLVCFCEYSKLLKNKFELDDDDDDHNDQAEAGQFMIVSVTLPF